MKVSASAAVAGCAVLQATVVLRPQPVPMAVAGFATAALALYAAARHLHLAGSDAKRARRAWAFAGAATLLWAVGAALYAVDALLGRNQPPPRLGDWCALAAVLIAPGVLWSAPSAPASTTQRLRLTVDGAMVAGALFVLAWPHLLRPTYVQLGSLAGLLAAGVPAVHIVCLSIAVVLLSRSRVVANAITVLAAGFGLFALSTLVYVYVGTHGGSWQAHSLVGGFGTATVLLMAASQYDMPSSERSWAEATTGLRAAVPYVPVAGAFTATAAMQHHVDAVMTRALWLVGVLVLVRQYLTLRTNTKLLAEVQQQRELLAHQATHDYLTGLPNRSLLTDRLAGALRTCRADRPVGLILVDLDGFKQVNDTLGHPAGDEVLILAARTIRDAVDMLGIPARLGGDEFAVLLTELRCTSDATPVADRLIGEITAAFAAAGLTLPVGASAGVSVADQPMPSELMLRIADDALYRAKRAGKGRAVGQHETSSTRSPSRSGHERWPSPAAG